MYGCISVPLLAMAEVTMAICSGVAAVLYWPIEDAVCDLGHVVFGVEVARVGADRDELLLGEAELLGRRRPSCRCPRSAPTLPKTVLQDTPQCLAEGGVLAGDVALVLGQHRGAGQGSSRAAATSVLASVDVGDQAVLQRAAAAVTTLKVEPGG